MIKKILIVGLVCLIQTFFLANGVSEADIEKAGEACQKQVNATDDDRRAVLNVTTPMTKIQGCLTNCLFKKFKIVGMDNKINITTFLDIFGDSSEEESAESGDIAQLEKALKGCAEKYNDKDECIAAKTYIECITDKMMSNS